LQSKAKEESLTLVKSHLCPRTAGPKEGRKAKGKAKNKKIKEKRGLLPQGFLFL
jgi:hypothetical protein